uniref:Ovule protein n=1 Tax=Heterorhabditis bacteriophora TaxID=37862 RepID=A0A1I7X5J4_HETBA
MIALGEIEKPIMYATDYNSYLNFINNMQFPLDGRLSAPVLLPQSLPFPSFTQPQHRPIIANSRSAHGFTGPIYSTYPYSGTHLRVGALSLLIDLHSLSMLTTANSKWTPRIRPLRMRLDPLKIVKIFSKIYRLQISLNITTTSVGSCEELINNRLQTKCDHLNTAFSKEHDEEDDVLETCSLSYCEGCEEKDLLNILYLAGCPKDLKAPKISFPY